MLLGIDLGTGSVKALLLAADGTVLGEAAQPYSVRAPEPGWAESDPAEWWEAVAIAVRSAVQDHANGIRAIGLSGQMHGVVLTDAIGQPLRPAILWADTRSSSMLKAYYGLAVEMQQRLANPIAAGMAGASLLWLREHEPESYRTARWALQPKDWLRFRLTGVVSTEPSDASATLLYDVLANTWALDIVEALKLRTDWLATLMPSSQIAGRLTTEAAEHLGLPAVSVVAGAADTAAALLGSSLVEGSTQLTIGSAAQIVTLHSQPTFDPQQCIHCYCSALPNQWYSLAAIQNAGLALEWVRSMLGLSWQQVYGEAFAVAAGCGGLTFLPYLTGDRTPHLDANARGAWVGLGLHHTRADLMRSALEGVAFSLRQGLEAIRATGVRVTELRLAGGGTLEPAWRQLLADVLQVPLHSVTVAAASARGAAILAGMGTGIDVDVDISANTTSLFGLATMPSSFDAELEVAWRRFCSLYPALQSQPDLEQN